MSTNQLAKSTATLAAWNLATFERRSEARIKKQAQGLCLLDAEFTPLVEVKNAHHLNTMVAHLANYGVAYHYTLVEQAEPAGPRRPMHIAALYKNGVEVSNATLLEASDLGSTGQDNPGLRKALVCDVNIAKLDFN